MHMLIMSDKSLLWWFDCMTVRSAVNGVTYEIFVFCCESLITWLCIMHYTTTYEILIEMNIIAHHGVSKHNFMSQPCFFLEMC
jgi:hypothetical protein